MEIKRRDTLEQANKFMKDAMLLIQQWQVPADPANFSVVYEIVKGRNKALTLAHEKFVSEGRKIDNYCLEQWQRDYIHSTQPKESEWLSGLDEVLHDLQSHVVKSGYSVEGYIEHLDTSMTKIASKDNDDCVQGVLKEVYSATSEVKDQQAKLKNQLKVSQSETESLRAELTKLQKQAVTDPLTSLLNRRGLELYLDELKPHPHLLTIVVMDIDHFKRFNDDFGHLIGDVVLAKVAEQLNKTKPNQATAIRYGGEEFVLLMTNTDAEIAAELAENLRQKVAAMKLINGKTKQRLPAITISLGVAVQKENERFDSLINRADLAMYEAKESGRNQCKIA